MTEKRVILYSYLTDLKETILKIEEERRNGNIGITEWERYVALMSLIERKAQEVGEGEPKEYKQAIEELWKERERLVRYIKAGSTESDPDEITHFERLRDCVENVRAIVRAQIL